MNISNRELLSRRCHFDDGCYTNDQIRSLNGYVESMNSTPQKVRCKGMKGVCMIMGLLVLVGQDSSGGIVFQDVVPDTFSIVSRDLRKKIRVSLKDVKSDVFSIPTRLLNRGNLKINK